MQPETLEHLKMLQPIIDRMNRCSFECKKWSIGLVAGLLVAASGSKPWVAWYSVVPILVFWGLDAYYLRTERAFRKVFDAVRDGHLVSGAAVKPFEMPFLACAKQVPSYLCTRFASTIWPVHLSILVGTLIVANAAK